MDQASLHPSLLAICYLYLLVRTTSLRGQRLFTVTDTNRGRQGVRRGFRLSSTYMMAGAGPVAYVDVH